MAKPITITPDLKNKSSRIFNKQLSKMEANPITIEEKTRIFSLVEKVLSNSKQKKK